MLTMPLRTCLDTSRRAVATQARSCTTASTGKKKAITLKNHTYTAHAAASGKGRSGLVISNGEVPFSLRLARPKVLGGDGEGQNPEQLFAMGYASCFLGALQVTAGRLGKADAVKGAVVRTSVHLGEVEKLGGFGIAVDIQVGGVEDEALIKAAHEACPYSRALTHGATVNLSKI